ncbi:MAG TPA: GDYXXLXY domain-containing protein [Opitutaceae bacterium]|nr:GDYXXLXY domain-containing protein [Opitutaceae bacterium]
MNRTKWFVLVVAAQAVFLLGWAGWHEHIRGTAPIILLQTHPIDPRDLLRGDYLMLNYDISTPPLPAELRWEGKRPAAAAVRSGTEVCVVLARRGRYYEAMRVTREEPLVAPDEIWVHGTLADPRRGRVTYGIEEYFVPEGKGAPPFGAHIEVEASVSSSHRLYVHRVLVEGKNYP